MQDAKRVSFERPNYLSKIHLSLSLVCFFLVSISAALGDDRYTLCGPDIFNVSSGPQCGVAEYNLGVDAQACGTTYREVWSDWGRSCDEKLNSLISDLGYPVFGFGPAAVIRLTQLLFGDEEVRVHRRGLQVDVQRRKLCKFTLPNMCRHPNFQPARYNSCSHPDFGVAANPVCESKMQRLSELRAIATTERSYLQPLIRSTRSLQTSIYALTSNEVGFACSIIRAEKNPLEVDSVSVLEQSFQSVFLFSFRDKKYDCQQMAPVGEVLCNESEVSAQCNAIKQYNENLRLLEQKKSQFSAYESEARSLGAQLAAGLFTELNSFAEGFEELGK